MVDYLTPAPPPAQPVPLVDPVIPFATHTLFWQNPLGETTGLGGGADCQRLRLFAGTTPMLHFRPGIWPTAAPIDLGAFKFYMGGLSFDPVNLDELTGTFYIFMDDKEFPKLPEFGSFSLTYRTAIPAIVAQLAAGAYSIQSGAGV